MLASGRRRFVTALVFGLAALALCLCPASAFVAPALRHARVSARAPTALRFKPAGRRPRLEIKQDGDAEAEAEQAEQAGAEAGADNGRSFGAASAALGLALAASMAVLAGTVAAGPEAALAATSSAAASAQFDMFDPSQFQPVCPGSDGVYQVLKYTANGLVGADNVVEYGPLIASVLLRVRLELCVLESFIYEAVVPFVRTKGVSWILPLHETVETVLAGTIFAVASNFILLGSTKILSVLFIYADALTGMPTRFLGGQAKKNLKGPASTVGAGFKAYGDALGAVRGFLEAADTFVGRYLVIATTVYIAFKIAHYKLFNDLL